MTTSRAVHGGGEYLLPDDTLEEGHQLQKLRVVAIDEPTLYGDTILQL